MGLQREAGLAVPKKRRYLAVVTDAPKGLRPEAARYAPTRTRRDLRQDAVGLCTLACTLACMLAIRDFRKSLGNEAALEQFPDGTSIL